MNILLKINYLQLTAKTSSSFFKFNPRLFRGNPFGEAGGNKSALFRAINLLFNRTLLILNLKN
jgi:hypothetical protein